jgi:hypothetical protein
LDKPRAYLGRETAPRWLASYYFETIFEDPEALHEYVLDLHRGKRAWPEMMVEASGWFTEQDERPLKREENKPHSRFLTMNQVLDKVRAITGESINRLRETEYGPRANPARRFAVWALAKHTQMTHSEIGKTLNMSANQAAHVLRRVKFDEEPFKHWSGKWQNRYVSSGWF